MLLIALTAAVTAGSAPSSINSADWERAIDYARLVGGAMILPEVRIELTVDENGDPVHCNIIQSNEAKGFDGRYCTIPMRRARFKPARDEDGKPVVGVYPTDFHYRIGQGSRGPRWVDYSLTVNRLPEGQSPVTVARVVTDIAGRVESCVIQVSGGVNALDDAACAYTRSAMTFTPPTDRDGRPVRAMRLVNIGFAAGPAGSTPR